MKAFDLRPVMALLNNFTASIRELVLEVFQQVRLQKPAPFSHLGMHA